MSSPRWVVLFGWLLIAGCGAAGDGSDAPEAAAPTVNNRGAGKEAWWEALPRPEWEAFERVDEGTGWFEVYRLLPGVLAIYEPGQFEEVISYLILGEERALLFDTGLGIGDMRSLVGSLTDLPVAVLNSHSHYDHIGGNRQFGRIYGPDTAYTRERMNGLEHDQVAEAVSPAWLWKDTPAGFDPAGYAIGPYRIDEVVGEGTVIDLGGRSLEVLMTPGHAPDSLCLLDRDGALLFTGDTFYPAPLYAHLTGSDLAAYRASAHRLAAMAPLVRYLLPGHNVGLVGGEYLIRMSDAFDAVAAGEAPYVVTDGNREYRFEDFSIIVPGA